VMQNLLDSHDTDRIASRIVNRDLGGGRRWWDYYQRSKADNPDYDTRKPTPEERRVQKLMVLMQFTFPGAPMVYYGDEAGMWGANDPCCRKPMVWQDMAHEEEAVLPDGSPRPQPDPVAFDSELHNYYRTLIRLRNERPALRIGDFSIILADDRKEMLTFRRGTEDDQVIVAINRGTESVEWESPELPDGTEVLFFTGSEGKSALRYHGKEKKAVVSLPPVSGVILGHR